MTLYEFIKKFVRPNSLIKLWQHDIEGYKLIQEEGQSNACMEWKILSNKAWQCKYNDSKVLGVKDIVCDDFYREAINIVIEPIK